MEIHGDSEGFEIDPTTLVRANTRSSNEDDRKEAYLEHIRYMASEAIKASEIQDSEISSLNKA